MRWKFKFKPDWDYLFTAFGNVGIGLFTSGIISHIFEKPKNEILIATGIFAILLAWFNKSIKIKNKQEGGKQ